MIKIPKLNKTKKVTYTRKTPKWKRNGKEVISKKELGETWEVRRGIAAKRKKVVEGSFFDIIQSQFFDEGSNTVPTIKEVAAKHPEELPSNISEKEKKKLREDYGYLYHDTLPKKKSAKVRDRLIKDINKNTRRGDTLLQKRSTYGKKKYIRWLRIVENISRKDAIKVNRATEDYLVKNRLKYLERSEEYKEDYEYSRFETKISKDLFLDYANRYKSALDIYTTHKNRYNDKKRYKPISSKEKSSSIYVLHLYSHLRDQSKKSQQNKIKQV